LHELWRRAGAALPELRHAGSAGGAFLHGLRDGPRPPRRAHHARAPPPRDPLAAPPAAAPTPVVTPSAIPPEERRQVTVLFADLSGYTAFAERMDPEAVKSPLDRALARRAPQCTRARRPHA